MALHVIESSKGTEKKYSRMGIASFTLAILLGVLAYLIIEVAVMLEASTPGDLADTTYQVLGLAFISCPLASLVGLGLGLAGLIQRSRKKLFATLGVVGNALVILEVLKLIVAGLNA